MGVRVTSSRFIGRSGELAECEAALREASCGSPSAIAIGGDSGVGKTRLIRAFQDAAAGRARFLRGECVELDDGELPYAPLIGALRELGRCEDPVLERMSVGARSALAPLLPSLADTGGSEPDDESAQLRLFEAVLELLELLGEEQPVVLTIEDVHWADRSTRAFTAFLTRSLRRERVLFLFSYRTDELHRRHPLLALLAELDHGERTRRIVVGPWGPGELGEALEDILGAAADEELLDRLFVRAEGNPLYTEELLAAGLDGRGAAPQSLRDAFLLRLERLSSPAQHLLRVLATARSADEGLLAAVSGLPRGDLTAALREAVRSHVIEAGDDGRFAFRHALLREVAYEDLLPGERAALHLGLAHALAARPHRGREDAVLTAQIAAHAHAAGDRALTLEAAVTAAAQASSIHAHGEAADLLERALEAWPHVADAARVAGVEHVELLVRAAAEHEHDGQRSRAESMLLAALGEVDDETEPLRASVVLDRLARVQWGLSRGDEALASARHALELLPPGRADAERAGVLAWLARTTGLRGRYRDALEAARGALAIVRASGAGPGVESQALNTLGIALVGSGLTDEGVASLREALSLALASRDLAGTEAAYVNLADVLLVTGRTEEALAVAREGLERAASHGRSSHPWIETSLAEIAIAYGDWELAASCLAGEQRTLEGRALLNVRLRGAELALGLGEIERARKALEEIEVLVAHSLEPQFHASFGLVSADLRRRCGAPELARVALEEALDRIEFCTDDGRRVTAIAAAGVATEADLAQRARDRNDEDALRQAEMLAELHVQRARAAAASKGAVEAAWLQTAEAELGRVLGGEQPAAWERAAVLWESLHRPYHAARVRLRGAEASADRGERDQAASCLAAARTIAVALGAGWLVQELDGLAARARLPVAAVADGGPGPPAGATAELPFGLTARELEVLMLVARGATNREIGAELFMAEKTASVHVSRILAKLDVRSRTQAAAVAHRAGLLQPPAAAGLGLERSG